ncbi:F-box only protein 6-like [Asterias rubens]|uniref:F-box only protein 6-like n=1 Tax=Asterias rubens TaxID=7604 RepID=UPI0014551402|nr:F-box only protein 6-like [Asterias rubens]
MATPIAELPELENLCDLEQITHLDVNENNRKEVDDCKSEVTYEASIDKLPEEALTNVISFVSDKWLLNCALVCRLWRNVIKGQTLWREKCYRTSRFIERYMAPFYPENWKEFYLKSPYTRNLIKNPSGKDGVKGGWIITENGGNGWVVETGDHGSAKKPDKLLAISDGSPTQFATSYGLCQRYQLIDLLQEGFSPAMLDEGQPDIVISEWYAARFDCANVYSQKVQLLRENSNEPVNIIEEFVFGPIETQQWAPNDWKEVRHIFSNYGKGLRFIKYMDESKDRQFWAGHYGSKMAGSVVKLQFHKDDPDE